MSDLFVMRVCYLPNWLAVGNSKCALSQAMHVIWNLAWNAVSNCVLVFPDTFSSQIGSRTLPLGA